jgi:hypothetical protein
MSAGLRFAACLLLTLMSLATGAADHSSRASAAPAEGHRIALGAYIPGASWHPGRVGRFASVFGREPVIVSDYRQWDSAPFVASQLTAVWRRGGLPMITWEPMSYRRKHYPLRAIAGGRFDRYLDRSARAARDWGHPILVRFAHEMNGNWYPWGSGVDGNTASDYKRAWRHVVRIFRRVGATNVRWVWTPYVDGGHLPFRRFYPGDRWVDWVGLDGFNWGYGGSTYSFQQIFGRSYRMLARLSSRPMMIAETGTTRKNKARWISQALDRQLPRFRRIRALVWFDAWANGVDLRLGFPAAAMRAFRSAARAKLYASTRGSLLELSRPP